MKPEIKSALERVFTRLERQLIAVAEEMPDDKYSFRPATGKSGEVRTFGEQLCHVAAVTSKADILKYAKESFAYIRRAVASINDDNALEVIPHPYDPERTKLTALPWRRDTHAMAGSTTGRWSFISA